MRWVRGRGRDRRSDAGPAAAETRRRNVPDGSTVPTARGTWEEAALVNVDITEVVKRQLRIVTPPWKK